MNIFEKMSGITAELGAVAKNLSVGVGRSAYKAVGEADILAAVKPLEEKYKVYSYPVSRKIIDSEILTNESVYNGTPQKKTSLFMRVETVYRFVNMEKPEEFIDIVSYGDGVDSNDKAPGKAMTYSDKYALMKAYKIITGDDPDQYASGDGLYNNAPKCECCGDVISGGKRKDGTTITAAQVADETKRLYGKALCRRCAANEAKK